MTCDGAKMIKCGAMFEALDPMPCQNEARCRAGLAAGKCGACDPAVVMCVEADLYECSMAGEMVRLETCDSAALCDQIGKKCEPAVCQMDEHDCQGGQLLRCKDDLTGFEPKTTCPMELCDKAGKKCNFCLPDSKMCVGDTLEVCSADGSDKQEMACPTDKPKCIKDKCVQCETVDDCMVPNDCQTTMCMDGTCTAPVAKAAGTRCITPDGEGVCDLLGSCVACNIDSDCAATERCSPLFGCIQRDAMTVTTLIPGIYTVEVNAGYGLEITGTRMGETVSVTGGTLFGTPANQVVAPIITPNRTSTQTVTFSGPGGLAGPLGFGCGGTITGATTATLEFAIQVTDGMTVTSQGTCQDATVDIRATGG